MILLDTNVVVAHLDGATAAGRRVDRQAVAA
jgi:predicted nucleic acid-binding protein